MCTRTAIPFLFFFNDTATTEIYPLSLHDALPISGFLAGQQALHVRWYWTLRRVLKPERLRSEEHTSELQSPQNLVCRLLLGKSQSWHPQIAPHPAPRRWQHVGLVRFRRQFRFAGCFFFMEPGAHVSPLFSPTGPLAL